MSPIHIHKAAISYEPSEQELRFRELLELAEKSDLPSEMQDLRRIGLEGFIIGLNAVLPRSLMQKSVNITEQTILFDCDSVSINSFSNILIVGGGKATAQMCEALIEILGEKFPFQGAINIPKGQSVPEMLLSPNGTSSVQVTFSSHPIPDENGIQGVQRMLDLIAASSEDTLIIALISGGGSALMPYPANNITLEEKQAVNKLLLKCGASIQEINAVRKHLSKFKGGQLSKFAFPRRVISLILSDVIGNDLQTIASGPTVPDLTSFKSVMDICTRYEIFDQLPPSVQQRIINGCGGLIPETPKPDPTIFDQTTNIIIGSAETSD